MNRKPREVQRAAGGENVGYGVAQRIVKAIHVAPSDEGRWTVRKAGRERISEVFSSRDEAMSYVLDLKPARSSEIILHKMDGTIEIGKVAKSGEYKVKSVRSPARRRGGPS